MKTLIRLLSVVLVFSGTCASAAELKVHDDWVAATSPVAKSQAAYICFINDNDKDVKITGVSAKGFGKAMFHQTMQHGDMTMMHPMESLVVPAHKMLTLEPGAMHIMLMDPEKIAVPGEKVTLTFEYSDKTKQTFELEVKSSINKKDDKMHKDNQM